jgi:hypothetical protein
VRAISRQLRGPIKRVDQPFRTTALQHGITLLALGADSIQKGVAASGGSTFGRSTLTLVSWRRHRGRRLTKRLAGGDAVVADGHLLLNNGSRVSERKAGALR